MRRGQALVEFALVLPVLMFLLLAFGEVAFLVAAQHGWQREADALADWSASHPDEPWPSGLLAGCDDVWVTTGELVTVDATCDYSTRLGLLRGIPVSVEAVAAPVPTGAVLEATGSPEASPMP